MSIHNQINIEIGIQVFESFNYFYAKIAISQQKNGLSMYMPDNSLDEVVSIPMYEIEL